MLEIFKRELIFALIAGLGGAALLILSIVFLVKSVDVPWIIIASISGLDVLLAAFYGFRILFSLGQAEKLNAVTEISFGEDSLDLVVTKGEVKASETKILYADILYYRVTKTYLIGVIGKGQYFPMEKRPDIIEFLDSKNIRKK